MGRRPNPHSRPYRLTAEALEQRRLAAFERWAALPKNDPARSLSGRPRKKRVTRYEIRGADGKFKKLS